MTDTSSNRPQMGDEELREISSLVERFGKEPQSPEKFDAQKTWDWLQAFYEASRTLMSRVRASLPQPPGEASSCKHEWLYATSKVAYDEGVFWSVPVSPAQYRECPHCSLQQTRNWHTATASTPAQSGLVEARRLKHAFAAGYEAKENGANTWLEAWVEYEPLQETPSLPALVERRR